MSLWNKVKESFILQVITVIAVIFATFLTGYVTGCWEFAKRAHASVAQSEVNKTTITSIQSQQEQISEEMYKRLDLILGEIQSVKKE